MVKAWEPLAHQKLQRNLHYIRGDVVGLGMFSPVLEDGQEGVQGLVGDLRNFGVVLSAQGCRRSLAGGATWKK